jgi:hypothetical protein
MTHALAGLIGFIAFPALLFALSRHDRKRINKLKDANGAVKKQGAHL